MERQVRLWFVVTVHSFPAKIKEASILLTRGRNGEAMIACSEGLPRDDAITFGGGTGFVEPSGATVGAIEGTSSSF